MGAEESGIIAGPPRPGGIVPWVLLEGAWLLLFVSLTVFIGASLQAAPPRWSAAAPGAVLFALHGLVGLHVFRTERTRVRDWFSISRRSVLYGVFGGAALVAFNGLYGLVLTRLGVEPPDVRALLESALPGPLLYAWGAVLAPVVEELYFRGRLLGAIDQRLGPRVAALTTSLAFAGMHLIPEFFPALLVFGIVLVWLRRRTGGLIAPLIAHAINNLVALL